MTEPDPARWGDEIRMRMLGAKPEAIAEALKLITQHLADDLLHPPAQPDAESVQMVALGRLRRIASALSPSSNLRRVQQAREPRKRR